MPVQPPVSLGAVNVLDALAVRTASGSTGVLSGYGLVSKVRAQLHVTEVSGVGSTLDVVIEDTLDGTNWNVIGTFTQRAAIGRQVIDITSPFTDQLRVRWTIAGTSNPSFKFSVVAYSEP